MIGEIEIEWFRKSAWILLKVGRAAQRCGFFRAGFIPVLIFLHSRSLICLLAQQKGSHMPRAAGAALPS